MCVLNKFKDLLSVDLAAKIYFAITAIALVYHFLIVTQIVDYKNVWGGQLESLDQMYTFEAFSVVLQLIFAGIIYLKAYTFPTKTIYNIAKTLTFLIAFIFLLNTLGNLNAKEVFERVVFTPLTLISSIVAFRIALD